MRRHIPVFKISLVVGVIVVVGGVLFHQSKVAKQRAYGSGVNISQIKSGTTVTVTNSANYDKDDFVNLGQVTKKFKMTKDDPSLFYKQDPRGGLVNLYNTDGSLPSEIKDNKDYIAIYSYLTHSNTPMKPQTKQIVRDKKLVTVPVDMNTRANYNVKFVLQHLNGKQIKDFGAAMTKDIADKKYHFNKDTINGVLGTQATMAKARLDAQKANEKSKVSSKKEPKKTREMVVGSITQNSEHAYDAFSKYADN